MARDRALRLLAVRDRSRRELERRLRQVGFEKDEIAEALDGLEAAGLIDDERFAKAVVEHETANRLSGRRAVISKLMASGVDRARAEEALATAGPDATRADELAAKRAQRLAGLPTEVAHRRLASFLLRRGHSPRVAAIAASKALGFESSEAPE
jgi:regulatory protein